MEVESERSQCTLQAKAVRPHGCCFFPAVAMIHDGMFGAVSGVAVTTRDELFQEESRSSLSSSPFIFIIS